MIPTLVLPVSLGLNGCGDQGSLQVDQVGHDLVGAPRRAAGVEEEDSDGDCGVLTLVGEHELVADLAAASPRTVGVEQGLSHLRPPDVGDFCQRSGQGKNRLPVE